MENKDSRSRLGVGFLVTCAFIVGFLVMAGSGVAMKGTDEAAFCAGCHVMADAAWSHKTSVHAKLACNECHAPQNIVSKLPFKAVAGVSDIYSNTFHRIADVIHATPETKDVVQENCRRCHTMTTSKVAMDVKPYCTDCHRSVPHGKKLPIAQRMAADV